LVKKDTDSSHARQYYQTSDQELAQRYVKGKTFLSREYCEAALEHRYALYPFVHELVPFDSWAGKRVLEVGCGQGADLWQFAKAGAQVYGVDLTAKHCQITRDFVGVMDGHARVTQGNAVRLPFRDASFDLVYSFGVLLLVEDLDAAVAEIHRVLKPGGTVITMFYNSQSLHYYVKTLAYYGIACDMEDLLGPRRLVDWFTDGFGYPRTYHQTPDSLRKAFDRFTIERIAVRNLTDDQIPLCHFDDYPPEFWSWVESRLGFYLMMQGRR
jgi:ubiquinone/menaquinone biosynthesis C-methylase UbiE